MNSLLLFSRKTVEAPFFNRLIIFTILAAAILLGFETNPATRLTFHSLFEFLHIVILGIFCFEALLKGLALSPRPWDYFRSGWNCFDFFILIACFFPAEGPFIAILRLARILRILRLVSVIPKLQLLVNALLRSIPSMGYVGFLLLILIYIYAILGVSLFSQNDPQHFGSLGKSMLSLFQITTLEGWADILYQQIRAETPTVPAWGAILYFVTYILLGTMIMLNLFIGIVLNGMQEIQKEAEAEKTENKESLSIKEELHQLENQLEKIKDQIGKIKKRC